MKRFEDGTGDIALAALFEATVVLGTDADEDGEFVTAQPGHSTRAGERRDSGLGGRDPIATSAQERTQLRPNYWHAFTVPRPRQD